MSGREFILADGIPPGGWARRICARGTLALDRITWRSRSIRRAGIRLYGIRLPLFAVVVFTLFICAPRTARGESNAFTDSILPARSVSSNAVVSVTKYCGNQDQREIRLRRRGIEVPYATFPADILDRAVSIADASWEASIAPGLAEASVTIQYTESEIRHVTNEYPLARRRICDLDESSLVVYVYDPAEKVYLPVPTERDRRNSRLTATISASGAATQPIRLVVGGWEGPFGKVPPQSVHPDPDGRWSFVIWGDPQVAGKSQTPFHRWCTPRLYSTIALTNKLTPEFVVTVGDNVHEEGELCHFSEFIDIVEGRADYSASRSYLVQSASLEAPLFCLMGNHDKKYEYGQRLRANGGNPGGDFQSDNPYQYHEFGNFLWMQDRLNAYYQGVLDTTSEIIPRRATYSFDAGAWHFILFSQPGLTREGVNAFFDRYHPESFEWLKADLEMHSASPTLFFTHHPLLPAGAIAKGEYGPNDSNRKRIVDLLTQHGNVRFAFYGHLHHSASSVPLISWRYDPHGFDADRSPHTTGVRFVPVPNSAHLYMKWLYNESSRTPWGPTLVTLRGDAVESVRFYPITLEDRGPASPVVIGPDGLSFIDAGKDWDYWHRWSELGGRIRINRTQSGGWQQDRRIFYDHHTKIEVAGPVKLPTAIRDYEIYLPARIDSASGTLTSRAGDYSFTVSNALEESHWTDAVVTIRERSGKVHRRLVAGNSINSVTLYGHEGELPQGIEAASYDLQFDNTSLPIYHQERNPPDFFQSYDDTVYGHLTGFAHMPLPPAARQIRNGGFDGSARKLGRDDVQPQDWLVNHFIHYAARPVRKRKILGQNGACHLYLFTQATERASAPWQGLFSEVLQVIEVPDGKAPVLSVDLMIPPGEIVNARGKPSRCSPYVVVSGYGGTGAEPATIVTFGFGPFGWHGGRKSNTTPVTAAELISPETVEPGRWYTKKLDVRQAYEGAPGHRGPSGKRWENLNLKRIVVYLGSYNQNFYHPSEEVPALGVCFDNVSIRWSE